MSTQHTQSHSHTHTPPSTAPLPRLSDCPSASRSLHRTASQRSARSPPSRSSSNASQASNLTNASTSASTSASSAHPPQPPHWSSHARRWSASLGKSASPFLRAGLDELRSIFDVEGEDASPFDPNDDTGPPIGTGESDRERLTALRRSSTQRPRSSSSLNYAHSSILPTSAPCDREDDKGAVPRSTSGERGVAIASSEFLGRRQVAAGLLLVGSGITAVCAILYVRDPQLPPPSLHIFLLSQALVAFLSLFALLLRITPLMDVGSRLMRAHTLAQGCIAVIAVRQLAMTAYVRSQHASAGAGAGAGAAHAAARPKDAADAAAHAHDTPVGSAHQQLRYLVLFAAQAAVPLAATLWLQYAVARRLAHLSREGKELALSKRRGSGSADAKPHSHAHFDQSMTTREDAREVLTARLSEVESLRRAGSRERRNRFSMPVAALSLDDALQRRDSWNTSPHRLQAQHSTTPSLRSASSTSALASASRGGTPSSPALPLPIQPPLPQHRFVGLPFSASPMSASPPSSPLRATHDAPAPGSPSTPTPLLPPPPQQRLVSPTQGPRCNRHNHARSVSIDLAALGRASREGSSGGGAEQPTAFAGPYAMP